MLHPRNRPLHLNMSYATEKAATLQRQSPIQARIEEIDENEDSDLIAKSQSITTSSMTTSERSGADGGEVKFSQSNSQRSRRSMTQHEMEMNKLTKKSQTSISQIEARNLNQKAYLATSDSAKDSAITVPPPYTASLTLPNQGYAGTHISSPSQTSSQGEQ